MNTTNIAHYDSANYAGLFKYIEDATIKNLTIRVSEFEVKEYSGTLCAKIMSTATGTTTIKNCHCVPVTNTVKLKLRNRSAGLIGGSYGASAVIDDCSNECDIVLNGTDSVNWLGGVIGCVEDIIHLEIRNCVNKGSIKGKFKYVAGIVSRVHFSELNEAVITGCKNTGEIFSTFMESDVRVGGILAVNTKKEVNKVTSQVTVSYCYNSADLTSYATVAGISGYSVEHLDHCVNTGNLLAKDVAQRWNGNAYGVARETDVYTSLNTGNIITERGGSAYGMTANATYYCFNAGEIFAHVEESRPYPLNAWSGNSSKSTGTINIGRVNGLYSFYGTTNGTNNTYQNYCDSQMVAEAHSYTSNPKLPTSQLTTGTALTGMTTNWVHTSGMYPRIEGLDTFSISIVAASPVFLSTDKQSLNGVEGNIEVGGCGFGVVWTLDGVKLEGDNYPCNANKQTIQIADVSDVGMHTLLATRYGVFKKVRFYKKVTPVSSVNVTSIDDLRALREGINTGAPFRYKENGPVLPAGGLGVTFNQTQNITMGAEDINWVPIGKVDAEFKGKYNGNNKKISGLTQSKVLNGGLFGYVSGISKNKWDDLNEAIIRNLILDSVNITEVHGAAGAIVAAASGVKVINCTVSGNITSYDDEKNNVPVYIGGIAGNVYKSAIRSCVNYCNITGYTKASVGGIVGASTYADKDSVSYCANYGTITSNWRAGGIAGHTPRIYYSYNVGEVKGGLSAIWVGGLAGHTGYVESCFNSGRVTSEPAASLKESYVGGLVGQLRNRKNSDNPPKMSGIKYSYNAGIVEGNDAHYTGGLFGCTTVLYDNGEWNSYDANRIEVKYNYVSNAVNGNDTVGAVFGYNKLDPSNLLVQYNYYDTVFQSSNVKGIKGVKGNKGEDVTGKAVGLSTATMVKDH